MDNFLLCICPKCNDTKNVRLISMTLSVHPIKSYICEECELEWDVYTSSYRDEHNKLIETISDVKIRKMDSM